MPEAQTQPNGKQEGRALTIGSTDNLRAMLEQLQGSMTAVATRHLTQERLTKIMLVAASRNPRLLQCTKRSVLESLMDAAEVGLEPNTPLKYADLIARWNSKINAYECQYQLRYGGLDELAYRSGQIAQIDSGVVHAKDKFVYTRGTHPQFEHVPHPGFKLTPEGQFVLNANGQPVEEDPGPIVAAYAIARFKDASLEPRIEVMWRKDIDRIRDRNAAKDKKGNVVGPWVTDYEEMARKTPERRLCKRLPLRAEDAAALEREERREFDATEIMELPADPDADKSPTQLLDEMERGGGSDQSVDKDTGEVRPQPSDPITPGQVAQLESAIKSANLPADELVAALEGYRCSELDQLTNEQYNDFLRKLMARGKKGK